MKVLKKEVEEETIRWNGCVCVCVCCVRVYTYGFLYLVCMLIVWDRGKRLFAYRGT